MWRQSIPHLSVPNQFDLLKIILDKLPFYSEDWASAFVVPFLALISFAKLEEIRRAVKVFIFDISFLRFKLPYDDVLLPVAGCANRLFGSLISLNNIDQSTFNI